MRSVYLKSVVLAVGLIGLGASLSSASAASTSLFNYSKTWRYKDAGTNMGTVWRETSYVDTAWPSLPGVFLAANAPGEDLYPTAVASGAVLNSTLLHRTNSAGTAQVVTYYFRTHFNFPNSVTSGVLLTLSNLVDDGAVFWLNGKELTRVHMPSGTVSYTTITGGNPVEVDTAGDTTTASLGGYTEVAVSPTNLVSGDNVLAVEVHDQSTTSTEVVFGMSMGFQYVQLPLITTQPASQTTYSNQTSSLEVVATGDQPLTYRWQKDTGAGGTFVNISGAVSPTYTFTPAGANNAGNYRAIVSNLGGSVTSEVANVTVLADTIKPVLLYAIARPYPAAGAERYLLDLFFSENIVLAGITNATYTIKQANSQNILTNRVFGSPTSNKVTLAVAPWVTNKYTLTISNLTDRVGNLIEPNTQVGIGFTTTTEIIPINKDWRFYEDGDITIAEANAAPPLPAGAWKTNNMPYPQYNAGVGSGVLYFEYDPIPNLCGGQRGWRISNGLMTYYFTTTFNWTNSSPTAQFQLDNLIDDGVVMYLNGAEVFRYNITGTPSYLTAATTVETALCRTNTFTATNLVRGVNKLAAELHQSAIDSTDAVFGVRLSTIVTTYYSIQPKLYIARANDDALLYWSGPDYVLEYVNRFGDAWTPVEVEKNQLFQSLSSADQRFWRLRKK